eukprot:13409399-Ditylum_brightwellii.AAC.1
MKENFDKIFSMLDQIQQQMDNRTAMLVVLDASISNNLKNDNQPPPPTTAPRIHFASASIFHMEQGGPEPWLDHAAHCIPPLLCPALLLHELKNDMGIYPCQATSNQ